jgi:hypothetical protein
MLEAIQYWQEFWQFKIFFVSLYYLSSIFGNPMVARVLEDLFSLQQNYFLSNIASTKIFSVICFSARKKFVSRCVRVGYNELV